MKKIFITMLLLLMCSVCCRAIETAQIKDMPVDAQIEKQLEQFYPQLAASQKNNDLNLSSQIAEKMYKFEKTGNPESIKNCNDLLTASIIDYNLKLYDLWQEKKYLNKAYKWAKIAIKDSTNQIYSIQAAIILGGEKLDTKLMKQAYTLYMTKDAEGAAAWKENFSKILTNTNKLIQERKERNAEIWADAIRSTGQSFNTGNHNSTNCYTIGNTMRCDSVRY